MNCPVCGADLPQEALFCGECGSSVTAKPKTRPLVRDPRPSDTTVIKPLNRSATAAPSEPATPPAAPPSEPATPPAAPPSEPATPTAAPPVPPAPPVQTAPRAGVQDGTSDLPGRATGAVDASPAGAGTGPETSASFILRFSTGERIVVSGTGLIGRRPIAQPGEQPEQLVSVADTGRSVSKTHLEFGIEAGDLWISDRYSANGTSIIQRSGEVRRCEPGRRYRVTRGAAVEIGDQRIDVD